MSGRNAETIQLRQAEIVQPFGSTDKKALVIRADPGDIMFHNELTEMAHRNDWLHYVPVVENPDSTYTGHCGYITADIIRDAVGHTDDKSFFICGPKGLYDFCLPELDGLGIRARQVRREMYGPPADIWEQPGWPAGIGPDDTVSVTVVGGPTIQVPATVPLLASLEKAGVMVPSLCRCGECSRCRIRIVSGTVYQLPGVPVRFSDRQFGYVHSCVSFPLENLDILV